MAKILEVIRESSDGQNDGSGPEQQQEKLEMFFASQSRFKGFEIVVKKYVQSTFDTEFEARRDYQDILSHLQNDDIPAFADTSRFSRFFKPSFQFITKLQEEGKVKFIIVDERIFDLNNHIDFTDLVKSMADEQRNSRTWFDKGKNGRASWRRKGFYIGGPIPPGYSIKKVLIGKKERSQYVIDQEKATKIYLRIADMFFDQSKSCNDIAVTFNIEKIPTSGRFKNSQSKWFKDKGQFWTGETIRQILRNPFYKGKIVNGQVVIPALITEEHWNKIQQEMTRRRKCGGTPKKMFLLRGLLRCGRCGSTLCVVDTVQKRMTKENYVYSKYTCGCRNLEKVYKPYVKECDLPPVHIKRLDEIVWNRVSITLLSEDALKKALTDKESKSDIPALQKKIVEFEKFVKAKSLIQSDLLELMTTSQDGIQRWSKDEIIVRYDDIEKDISKANNDIKLLQDRINGELELKRFLHTIRTVTEGLRKNLHKYAFEQKRELLLTVVEKVTVDYDSDKYVGEIDRDSLNVNIELHIKIKELCELLQIPYMSQEEIKSINDRAVLLTGQNMSR